MFRVFITALLIISLFGGITAEIALAENDVVKIGVLASRGPERCLEKWSPTAEYLTRVIQGKAFMIVPVDYDQIYAVVEKGEVDFILSNPSFYVKLEIWYGVSRIATLKNKVLDGIYTTFGGVVFTKKQRQDIRQYSDLKGKTFMAVEETSFGGWRMVWREFKEAGIDPFKDFAALSFGGTHDAVVYAVRDGKVDAGTARTDTLERMQAEGKINIADFKVIHEHGGHEVHLPFLHSTREYPEWPMAKVKHTPAELAEKVAAALLAMPADSPAARASESAGWTIPLNYQSVHECLKELKVGPYKDFGEITLLTVFKKYRRLILINFVTLIILAWFLSARIKLSRKLKTAHGELQSEVDERKRSEEKIRHLNDVLRSIRNINLLIVTVKDRQRLIQRVCDNLVTTRGYYNTWIALFDEAGKFIAAAEAGVGEGFSRVLEMLERGDLMRCCREALGQSSVLVIANPVEACKDCPQVKGYVGREAMAIRLEYEDKVYGILSVSVPKGAVTDREELALFNEVAGDIAFALHNIEQEEKRKRSEEALKESEGRYRTLVESSTDVILMMDNERKIVSYNQSFLDLFGYDKNEVEGKSIRIIHRSDESFRSFGEMFYPVIEEVGFFRAEWEFISKDGAILPVETVTSNIKSDDGSTKGYIAIIRDVTERKKLEAQFIQAQKMEAIGLLAGGVAHDFNNLLSVIIGNAHLALMKAGKDDPLREEVEEINLAGKRAAALTRQLLAFSRKQIIQPEIMDLNELLTGIEKMLGRLIGEDVEILVIPQPALWPAEVDSGQMEQVIMNLTVNARDAMPKGGKFTVETANVALDGNYFRQHGIEEEQPGTYVMLAVSDTGIGMDKETREHIFEPFFTTKEIGKGSGLGLSTVYGIVKQNKGFVWVYSEPGQGTTFKIYLPKYKGDAEPEDKDRTPVAELDGSETVLIVEDDDRLRKFARKALQSYGYRILDAEDGEDALRVGEEHDGPINLLIADVVMPKMSGKEAADRLQPLYPQMKVIYMSGYTDNSIAHHGILEPGLNFLEKPFTPEVLARKVREILNTQ